jgi:hypothetical protein
MRQCPRSTCSKLPRATRKGSFDLLLLAGACRDPRAVPFAASVTGER